MTLQGPIPIVLLYSSSLAHLSIIRLPGNLILNLELRNTLCLQFFYTSPLACDLSGLPVVYNKDDEANPQRK